MRAWLSGNGKVLDEIVELWNKMTDAGVEHEAHMVHNVGRSSLRSMCLSL